MGAVPDHLLQRALADYRAMRPEDDDLPDEVVADLLQVRLIALRYAFRDLGRAFVDEYAPKFRRHWPWLLAAWVVAFALVLFLQDDPFRCTSGCP